MAIVTLDTATFASISDGTTAVRVQFRGSVAQIAQSATPAAEDWIEADDGEVVAFPAGSPVYARAANRVAVAVVVPNGTGGIMVTG